MNVIANINAVVSVIVWSVMGLLVPASILLIHNMAESRKARKGGAK